CRSRAGAGLPGTRWERGGLPGVPPSAARRDSEFLLDLSNRAGFVIEEVVVDFAPAAELVDREEIVRGRELLRVDELLVDGAVPVFGPDFLSSIGPDTVEEVLSGRLRRVFADGDRSFDLDRRGGNHVFD